VKSIPQGSPAPKKEGHAFWATDSRAEG
jgi:hypothetical protein